MKIPWTTDFTGYAEKISQTLNISIEEAETVWKQYSCVGFTKLKPWLFVASGLLFFSMITLITPFLERVFQEVYIDLIRFVGSIYLISLSWSCNFKLSFEKKCNDRLDQIEK